MKTTIVHVNKARWDVYIGRAVPRQGFAASKWSNPFMVGRDGDRDTVILKYGHMLDQSPELLAALPELRGKVLGCWCAPRACHGSLLAARADALPEAQP